MADVLKIRVWQSKDDFKNLDPDGKLGLFRAEATIDGVIRRGYGNNEEKAALNLLEKYGKERKFELVKS